MGDGIHRAGRQVDTVVVRLPLKPSAIVTQPDGSTVEVRACDLVRVDELGWTHVRRPDAPPRRPRSWIGLFRRD